MPTYLHKNFKKIYTQLALGIWTAGSVPCLLPDVYTDRCNKKIELHFNNDCSYIDFSWIYHSSTYCIENMLILIFFIALWFMILYFISFINIGIVPFLFLLEVSMFTPIISLILINTIPITSILFLINAIAMEAVVAVIVVLFYIKDWKFRDFTKFEILENNLTFINLSYNTIKNETFKKTLNKKISWYYYLYSGIFDFLYFYIKVILQCFIYVFITLIVLLLLNYLLTGDCSIFLKSDVKLTQNIPQIYLIIPKNINITIINWIPKINIQSLGISVNFKTFFLNFNKEFLINKFFNNSIINYFQFNNWYLNNNTIFQKIYKLEYHLPLSHINNNQQTFSNIRLGRLVSKINPKNVIYNLNIFYSANQRSDTYNSNSPHTNKNFINKFEYLNLNKNINSTNQSPVVTQPYLKNNHNLIHQVSQINITNMTKENYKQNKIHFFNFYYGNRLFNLLQHYLKINGNSYDFDFNLLENRLYFDNNNNLINNSITNIFFDKWRFFANKRKTTSDISKNNEIQYRNFKKYKFIWNKLDIFNFNTIFYSRYFYTNIKLPIVSSNINKMFNIHNNYRFINYYSKKTISKKKTFWYYKNINILKTKYNRFNIYSLSNFKINTILNNYYNNYFTKKDCSQNIKISESEKYLNWGDKSFENIFLNNGTPLPWFENSNSSHSLFDLSNTQIFDKNTTSNENRTLPLFLDKNNIIKHITKKQHKIKKKYNNIILNKYTGNYINRYLKTKQNIWNSPINWYYSDNLENLYSYNYKNILTIFYENSTYLKRIGYLSSNFVDKSNKLTNQLGTSDFDYSQYPIYSLQSREFGLISTDFVNLNNDNITFTNNLFNTNNYLKSKIIFSYKKINLNNLKNSIFYKNSTMFIGAMKKNLLNNDKKNRLNSIHKNKKISTVKNKKFTNFQNIDKKDGIIPNFNNYLLSLNKNNTQFEKIKTFWKPENKKINYHQKNLINKNIITDRFLKTFRNKIVKRNNSIQNSINRFDAYPLQNKNLNKFLDNNFRMLNISNLNILENNYYLNNFNKIIKNNDKKYIKWSDSEIKYNNIQYFSTKPHTLYGFVWDEYLKQTYGTTLNFLKFDNKIPNTKYNQNKSINFTTLSNNFQNNIEKDLNTVNNYIGMTQNTEIANSLISKIISKVGFYKEIGELDLLDEDFELRRKRKYKKKEIKKKKRLKLKKYFKREIVSDSIYKSRLIKKSIKLINKYEEKSIGYKFNKTPIGVKLPYVKRKIIYINENSYYNYKFPKYHNWLKSNNKKIHLNNRAYFTNIYKFKNIKNKKIIGSKKMLRKARILKNFGLDLTLDISQFAKLKNFFLNKNIIFKDNDNDYYLKNFNKNTVARNLRRIKPQNKDISFLLKKVKKSSLVLFKKNRGKKLRNFRLHDKIGLNLNNNITSVLVSKYTNPGKNLSNINYMHVITKRSKNEHGDFHLFKNNAIQLIRNSIYDSNTLLENFKKKKYLNISNYLKMVYINNNWGLSKKIKLKNPDNIFFENLNAMHINNTKKISNTYLLSEYNDLNYLGFINNNETFVEHSVEYTNISDNKFCSNNNFEPNNASLSNYLNEKKYSDLDIIYKKRYSYAGLINITSSNVFNFENFTNFYNKKLLISGNFYYHLNKSTNLFLKQKYMQNRQKIGNIKSSYKLFSQIKYLKLIKYYKPYKQINFFYPTSSLYIIKKLILNISSVNLPVVNTSTISTLKNYDPIIKNFLYKNYLFISRKQNAIKIFYLNYFLSYFFSLTTLFYWITFIIWNIRRTCKHKTSIYKNI